jgi:hypothetical protein
MYTSDDLSKAYFSWATKKIKFDQKENFVIVKTPFVDIFHDQIEVFVNKESDRYIVTDDGYTLDELDSLGIEILKFSKKRKEYFKQVLMNFGVTLKNKELLVFFDDINQFPSSQNRLIQCMLQIFDMLQLSRSKVANLFIDDISD